MTMLHVFKWPVMCSHSSTPPRFAPEIMASVLLLAHTAQEMPEWERWEISRERTREKYELRDIVPNELILTGSSQCQRTVSSLSVAGSGSWISSLAETPVSTHTNIWPFSHSEVQAGGNKPFFPLWGIQHEYSAHAYSLESVEPVQQKPFNGGWAILTSLLLSQRAGYWSTTELIKRGGPRAEARGSLASAAPAALL